MSKTVTTSIIAIVNNEISEEEVDRVLEDSDHDSIEDYAKHLEGEVEALLQHRIFSKADDVPVMDVSTYVDESGDL